MSRQYWGETLVSATAGNTVTVQTEATIFNNITIPANYMQDARTLRLWACGHWSTGATASPTLVLRVAWGDGTAGAGTTVCKTGSIALLTSKTNCYWELDVKITTRSNGSTGTMMGNGLATVFADTAPTIGSATGAPAVAPLTNGGQTGPAVATANLTIDTVGLSLTSIMAITGGTMVGDQYTLEAQN